MAIWKSESVCHVIQDVVYGTTEESGWGETFRGSEMHSLEGGLELKHSVDNKKSLSFYTIINHFLYSGPLFEFVIFRNQGKKKIKQSY